MFILHTHGVQCASEYGGNFILFGVSFVAILRLVGANASSLVVEMTPRDLEAQLLRMAGRGREGGRKEGEEERGKWVTTNTVEPPNSGHIGWEESLKRDLN